jgi:hypothetical protein
MIFGVLAIVRYTNPPHRIKIDTLEETVKGWLVSCSCTYNSESPNPAFLFRINIIKQGAPTVITVTMPKAYHYLEIAAIVPGDATMFGKLSAKDQLRMRFDITSEVSHINDLSLDVGINTATAIVKKHLLVDDNLNEQVLLYGVQSVEMAAIVVLKEQFTYFGFPKIPVAQPLMK